jgi:hypothetical protein
VGLLVDSPMVGPGGLEPGTIPASGGMALDLPLPKGVDQETRSPNGSIKQGASRNIEPSGSVLIWLLEFKSRRASTRRKGG